MIADTRAVRRYARALFALAESRGETDQAEGDLAEIRRLVERHPEIPHLVLNSTISFSEKEDFIQKIVPAQTLAVIKHFLMVLIRKKRFREFALIQEEFHRLYEKKQGLQEVEIVSAAALTAAHEERLKALLERKLGSKIRIVKREDAGLIGGLVLRFDGREVNASFRARLEELRQQLSRSS